MAGDFDESAMTKAERDAEAVQVLGIRLAQVEAERDRLIEANIKLDVQIRAALAELDALRNSGYRRFYVSSNPSPARLSGDHTGA